MKKKDSFERKYLKVLKNLENFKRNPSLDLLYLRIKNNLEKIKDEQFLNIEKNWQNDPKHRFIKKDLILMYAEFFEKNFLVLSEKTKKEIAEKINQLKTNL